MPGSVQGMDNKSSDESVEFRASVERWLDGLTGEDERMRDAFLAEYESRDHLVERLVAANVLGGSLDMSEAAGSFVSHAEGALADDVMYLVHPMTAVEVVCESIVRGDSALLGHLRPAAEAVGLDIVEVVNQGIGMANDLNSGNFLIEELVVSES